MRGDCGHFFPGQSCFETPCKLFSAAHIYIVVHYYVYIIYLCVCSILINVPSTMFGYTCQQTMACLEKDQNVVRMIVLTLPTPHTGVIVSQSPTQKQAVAKQQTVTKDAICVFYVFDHNFNTFETFIEGPNFKHLWISLCL